MAALLPSKFYCTPAIVYLVLSTIAIIAAFGTVSMFTIVIKIIFVLLWAWFLNYLCESGYSAISWFLVLLPLLFTLLIIVIATEVIFFASENNLANVVTLTPTIKR